MADGHILYFGDTALPGPASYLAGILTHYGLPFTHIPSDTKADASLLSEDISLYILSDYPSAQFDAEAMDAICERVRAGAGLLMFGGWESYHGLGGDYDTTPLAELLPVTMASEDDRRNESQLILVRKTGDHPVLEGLPFHTPPGIGGYNAFQPKPEAETILEGEIYRIDAQGDTPSFTADSRFPLLVVQDTSKGRRACLATDVAPHWVGGFVDWGDKRLTVHMGEDFIEVGAWYASFFHQLVAWCSGRKA